MAKTILITGASSGIGRATALYFAERGWNVAATMRDPLKADPVLQHPQISLFALDVTNADSIAPAIAATLDRYQKIDVLLNNAGYGLFGPIEAIDSDQIQQQFATNLFGLIRVTQQVLRSCGAGRRLDPQHLFHRRPFGASLRLVIRCDQVRSRGIERSDAL